MRYVLFFLLIAGYLFSEDTNIVSTSMYLIQDSNTQLMESVSNRVESNIVIENTNIISNTNMESEADTNQSQTNIQEEEPHIEDGDFSPTNIFNALLRSYPGIVEKVPMSENPYYPDLAIKIRDTIFYNVHGRFLPQEERDNWKTYSSNTVYSYPKEIPDPYKRTKSEIAMMKRQGSKSYRKSRKPTYYGFNEKLYGMSKLADTNDQIVKARFLGKQVLIHQFAYASLMQVEKEIYELTNDMEYKFIVETFLKEGDTVYSFFWRNIAGSKSRSLHSYGVAVDVLPEGTKKALYWLWRQAQKINWIQEPVCVRWNPPDVVVEIFEKYGFVWGGKWNFYDTMHFEYKPEILLLNGYQVEFLSQEKINETNDQTIE